MTVEEIKQVTDMRDVVRKYGIRIRSNGMCSCPFHGTDKNPSMKIYKDGFKCFGCNRAGDAFKFVMEMENCSFKDAFISLGGTYEHLPEEERKKRNDQFKQERDRKLREQKQLEEEIAKKNFRITQLRDRIETMEPLSDAWCEAMEEMQSLLVEVGCYD